ncbi:hypothetical protein ES707_16954 [subsurface metagenome]
MIIGILVKTYLLPIVMRIVALRNWLYVVLKSEEGEEHREEIMADIRDEIACYRLDGDSNDSIAVKIFIRLAKGMPSDTVGLMPFVPAMVSDKVNRWGDTLRHYRVPTAMIVGVATLGLMNYSFFSSPNNQAIGHWLLMNGIIIVMTILLWKLKHPLARRILNTWIGIAIVACIAIMAWLTINYRLYEIMTFKVLMLAMVAVLPTIIVVDKSWRNRLFGGRWWLIAVCWAPIIAGVFAGSLLVSHSVKPLLEMWAVMALLAVGMFIVYGAIGLAAYVLCLLGIRGSAGGLRLVASGIRHLR